MLEENHRHAIHGHAEYDDRCEACVEDARHREASKTCVCSESCACDCESGTFKPADETVTVLIGGEPRGE